VPHAKDLQSSDLMCGDWGNCSS